MVPEAAALSELRIPIEIPSKIKRAKNNMPEKEAQFFERCAFLTQYRLIGWKDAKTPIWGKMIEWGNRQELPVWNDWDGIRERLVRPLCKLADSVTLFGIQWTSDEPEVMALKTFVDTKFKMKNRRMVCDEPSVLADHPLFWINGTRWLFCLIPVLSFKIDHLPAVLEILRYHNQAGKMSPRYNAPFTAINSFSKSVAEKGGFAIVFTAHEAEVFYPIEHHEKVTQVASEIEARREAESKMVRQRTHQA